MGHVDHGKTSLLDAIRVANVAGKEAGGITQHIGAYHVEKNGRKIVFIDTPGHEAFTRMRARGAKVTDIVVLVVAADDGVMPQTLEAIDHARAAKVPIIVAINKIDKPDAQPERIKQQLSDRGLLAEDWGGDTVMVPVSAKMKTNLDLLLEMILLVADLQDLKANPEPPGHGQRARSQARSRPRTGGHRAGAQRHAARGRLSSSAARCSARCAPCSTTAASRSAKPSLPRRSRCSASSRCPKPATISRWSPTPPRPSRSCIFREAKGARSRPGQDPAASRSNSCTSRWQAGEVKELPIILKTDVGGSAEVLTDTLQKLSNDKVKIRVLHSGVGAINESDVLLASASNAIIIGFNVRPERNAAALAEQEKVDVRLHTIIYNLTDEIKRAMTGLLEPVFKEVYKGKAEVRETFRITKVGNVAGCMVQDGTITRDSRSAAAARQRGGLHRQGRLAAPLQGRRERGEERHGVRHHARELRAMSSRTMSSRRSSPSASPPKSSPEAAMAAIGVLTLELRLENSHSLKDKRHVVKSLKDRLRGKFNVAVAEIDYQDLWQRAVVAAVTVSSDHVHAEKVLQSVEDEAAALLGPELAGATVEWL